MSKTRIIASVVVLIVSIAAAGICWRNGLLCGRLDEC